MSTAKDQRATKDPQTGAAGRSRSVRASAKLLSSPATRSASPDLDAARARLASLPTDFTNRVFDDPAWPADVPEVIGPRN